MRVSEDAARRFMSLYTTLLYYAGRERGVLPGGTGMDDFLDAPLELKVMCREVVYEPTPIISAFARVNADVLSDAAKQTLAAWAKHFVKGDFIMLRHVKTHTIMLGTKEPRVAYAVLGLTTDLPEMIPASRLPASVSTVLLPYEGVIVCDGLLTAPNAGVGPEMRRKLGQEYKAIEKAGGLITKLG
jgi:hypothetical protein